MKAVLYGGGYYEENGALHGEMLRMSEVKKPRITYIPSCSEYGRADFPDFVRALKRVRRGCRFVYFPIDLDYSTRLEFEALSSDIIFLSGGNTYEFLASLRQKKLIGKLRDRSKDGVVLGGTSAGGILLTPSIRTASFPKWDRDDNIVNLRRLEALRLCRFEFFPHYSHSSRYREALATHTVKTNLTLLAAPDGGGVVVDRDNLLYVGKCVQFFNGSPVARTQ